MMAPALPWTIAEELDAWERYEHAMRAGWLFGRISGEEYAAWVRRNLIRPICAEHGVVPLTAALREEW